MNEGPLYISPNYVALKNTYDYEPIEKGMGFNVGLFGTILTSAIALTTTIVNQVSAIQLIKRQETLEKRAARNEANALAAENKKREELLAKNTEITDILTGGGQTPPTLTSGQVAIPGVGAVGLGTLVLGGGLVVAVLLLLKKRQS